jgi:tetratricopeptide (TPR) repeat protein
MKRERSRKRGERPPAASRPATVPAMKQQEETEGAERKSLFPPVQARRPAGPPAAPAAALSPGRKWLARLVAMFIPTLIILGGLELLLRVLGYGFDPHYFKRARVGGRECYVSNQDFGLRFFPRSMARFPPPVVIPAAKAPDTCRIFIFGESAALGDPRPNYAAGSYLEVLLRERFPQGKFEVINTAVTAINSHAILPIAHECARHDGDLWLVYMGNNEMVGPFGAVTVFGAKAPPLWLVRMQLQLRQLRLGQWLFELSQKFRKATPAAAGWHGMEMFVQNQVSPHNPSKQRVYRSFERNLEDILKAGRDSGAKIVLSTVAVNLKDCPPFGSVPGADLPATNRTAYEKLCQDGSAAEAQGRFADAQSDFERAVEMCPESAEAEFQLAACLMRSTNATAARPHFLKAVDNDTLPFRTDSTINETIRASARRFAGESLVLCDTVEALSAASPEGIPGEELFYEHVHLNPNGNYALALAWAGQVEKLLAPALKRGARPSWASQAECEQWLGLTDWNRVSILEHILQRVQRPPFSGQSGNTQQVARLRNEIAGLRQRLTDGAAAQAQEVYLRALRRAPENFRLHGNYAEFLEARHELKSAIAERKEVCELTPHSYFPYYTLGVDLKEAGALAEARQTLLKAFALKPDEGDVRLELGTVCARQGDWEQARRELEAARRFSPEDPHPALFLGEVLWKLERRSEALASLREAARLDPSDWQPHYRLGSDLAQQNQLSDAAVEYHEALRLNPASVRARLGLATVLANLGREPEAAQQVDEALKLEPTNPAALEFRRKFKGR